jgi:hypothetical protein
MRGRAEYRRPSLSTISQLKLRSGFLESWASPAASSVQQVSNHDYGNYQSDWTDSPPRAHTPVQTAPAPKKQQEHNQYY